MHEHNDAESVRKFIETARENRIEVAKETPLNFSLVMAVISSLEYKIASLKCELREYKLSEELLKMRATDENVMKMLAARQYTGLKVVAIGDEVNG